MAQQYGYAGKLLRVNLTTEEISTVPTRTYSDLFIGGRGIALKIHWDEVSPEIDALDPENRLVFMTGPVGGVPGFAGSRWMVSGKSPVRNMWSYCNLGGAWGAKLKFAGYDGIVIHGKSDRLVYLLIEDDKVEIRDASRLKGKGAIKAGNELVAELGKPFRFVAVGAAGENSVHFATLTGDQDSSGSGGLGAVMGSKNLKAIAVNGTGKIVVADKENVGFLRKKIKSLRLPPTLWKSMLPEERMKRDMCFGCINGCMRANYITDNGEAGKYICQSAMFYEIRAKRYYGEVTEVPYIANKLCDDYGMDTRAVEALIMWLSRCHKSNAVSVEEARLPLDKMGSLEFIEQFLHKIAFREGFGDVMADGTIKAAEKVGKGSDKFITDYMAKTGEIHVYGARLYLATGLLYAFDPRLPIQQLHEISTQSIMWAARELGKDFKSFKKGGMENYLTSDVFRAMAKRFWGDEICGDFSTYDGKAAAAAKIIDRQNAKECLILCDFSYPIYHSHATKDHAGDPGLESRIFAAITGRDIDEQGLYKAAERVFNIQRAIMVREGQKGRDFDVIEEFNFTMPLRGDYGNPDCLVPGRDGKPFARKGMVVDRDEFERMKDEFYQIRGWDVATGFQTRAKLDELDLADVADVMSREGCLV
ncbi:aldehyde ferredoxin oxidoreductase N-terminal domain-containing protein [Thermodesulfobacteriota bacterium]